MRATIRTEDGKTYEGTLVETSAPHPATEGVKLAGVFLTNHAEKILDSFAGSSLHHVLLNILWAEVPGVCAGEYGADIVAARKALRAAGASAMRGSLSPSTSEADDYARG